MEFAESEDLSAVAGLIIGNEVLTAKATDLNGPHLITRLREHGATVLSLHVVPDEVDAIVEALDLARKKARYVITSGGVGPTHDDVTMRAVALTLGRKIVRLPEMVAILRCSHPDAVLSDAVLRMAEAPEGSKLLQRDDAHFPVLSCDDIFMLPGVPQYFRAQLEVVLHWIPSSPVTTKTLFLALNEVVLTRAVDGVALSMPHVTIGSYPIVARDVDYRVKLTVEHHNPSEVDAAVQALKIALPANCIIRET